MLKHFDKSIIQPSTSDSFLSHLSEYILFWRSNLPAILFLKHLPKLICIMICFSLNKLPERHTHSQNYGSIITNQTFKTLMTTKKLFIKMKLSFCHSILDCKYSFLSALGLHIFLLVTTKEKFIQRQF